MAENEKLLSGTDDAVDFLRRFHLLLSLAKIYDKNNQTLTEQAGPLHRPLAVLLGREPEAVFGFCGAAPVFNGRRIEASFSNCHIFRSLAEEFVHRRIGSLTFAAGITEDELLQLVVRLAVSEEGIQDGLAELKAALAEAGIRHLKLEPCPPPAAGIRPVLPAVKTYFLGIDIMREFFNRQKRRAPLSANLLKRWMQGLLPALSEEEPFFLGLTSVKNHGGYLANHAVNTAIFSIALGRRLGLARGELMDLGVSALLHDLGSLEVPSAIMDKPSSLSSEERAVVEKQSRLGAEKLIPGPGSRELPVKAFQVALEHRLRADLANAPPGSGKKSLHLFSRIVKIADAFDALTTKRVYRIEVFTALEALAMMKEQSGREFDELLLKAFAAMLGPYPVGSLVVLDTGELGIVFESNPQPPFLLRPTVKLITDARGTRFDGRIADLTEVDPKTRKFKRSVAAVLDPKKYEINPADYFLALAL